MSADGHRVVLVTGQRGFLGAHAANALAATGWEVVGAGRPEIEIPSPGFSALLGSAAPELVVHCAGPASVPAAEARPNDDRHGSVGVLESLVAALAETPRRPRLLLVSSAAVYGEPTSLPIEVGAGLAPISAYGRHRVECERVAAAGAVPAAIARVFSAYGEGLRRQVWWDIARRAADGETVVLQGTGDESRDFIHGSDVGRALAAIAGGAPFHGEAYNVATGAETTIGDLARALAAALDTGAAVEFTGAERLGDPHRWQADVSETAALGFEPRVSLADGIERYAAWVRTVL